MRLPSVRVLGRLSAMALARGNALRDAHAGAVGWRRCEWRGPHQILSMPISATKAEVPRMMRELAGILG